MAVAIWQFARSFYSIEGTGTMLQGTQSVWAIGSRLFLGSAALLLAASASLAADTYTLRPGDIVSFRVDAISNLNREMTVSPEGQINLPLVGWTIVVGKTIYEVEADARARIPQVVYRERVDGNELPVVVRDEEIVLDIKAFRPVYISGEVGRPGELTFRPEMTVRQAVALAGGLVPSAASVSEGQLSRIAALKAEHGALMASYVDALIDLNVVNAELSDKQSVEEADMTTVDLTADDAAFVTQTSQKRGAAEATLDAGERGYLVEAIRQNGQRIAALRAQQRQEEQGVEFDSVELDRIQVLADRGAVQLSALNDARRQWLLSSSRALGTRADIETAELRQAEFERQLERIGEERVVQTLDRFSAARAQVNRLHAQIEGMAEQLALQTAASDVAEVDRPKVSFTIYRDDGQALDGTEVELQTVLLPGDVIEIYQVALPGKPAE